MKTKYAAGAKPNLAGTGDTSRQMPHVELPKTDPLPTEPLPWHTGTPNARVVTPKETDALPMFNAAAGYVDTGATTSGDVGGAR